MGAVGLGGLVGGCHCFDDAVGESFVGLVEAVDATYSLTRMALSDMADKEDGDNGALQNGGYIEGRDSGVGDRVE